MKKRVLYIILGVMLFAKVGLGQGFISFNGIQNYIYNGNQQFTRTTLIIDYGTSDDESPITVYSYSGNSFSGIPYGPSPNKPTYAGNYSVTATVTFNDISGSFNSQPVLFTIAKATPILTITNPTLTYTANAQSATVSSSVAGNFPTALKYNGSTTIPKNAGTYTITADFTPNDAANYNSLIGQSAGNFTINKKPLTITIVASDKVYDGITYATGNITSEQLGSDAISFGYTSATFNNKNIGIDKTVTFTGISLDGADAGNYSLTSTTAEAFASITARQLTIADPEITKSKEYDKSVTANVIVGTLSNVVKVGSVLDVVTASAEGTYSTSTVGTSKKITVVYTLAGADKDNYIKPVDKVYTDGVITAKQLTIADPEITKSKEYDKTVTANVIVGTLSNVVKVGSVLDVVTASAEGTYSTSTVGTSKKITVVYTLAGADKDNYIKPVDKVYTDGVITAKQLTIADPEITKSKEYDKTVTANVIVGTLSNVVKVGSVLDVVTASAEGTYSTSTVGTSKKITVVYTLAGADKDNYIKPVDKVYTDGVITAKQLTIADPEITKSKEYDKTVTANVIVGTLSNVVKVGSVLDAVTASAEGTYSTSTVGTSKKITVVYTLAGADKDNYIKPVDKVYTDGVITAKQLTIADPEITKSKEYDKTVTANVIVGTLSNVVKVGSVLDVVTASAEGTYSTSTVGTSKKITVVYTLAGADKDNYIKPVDKVYTDGVITAKQLTIADPEITKSKEYDKTVTANVIVGTLSNVVKVGSVLDAVTASAEGTYSTSTVGTSKKITVVYTLAGADKDNYIKPVDKVYTDGVITVRSLTISATVSDKVYDGNTTATATLTDSRITGDVFTVEKTEATFNNKNIGTGKVVTVSGISLTGTDAGNYTLTSTTATGTASITVKSLTISATVSDKVYDGNSNAVVSLTDNRISDDELTVNKTGATFNNKNAGTAKTVTIAGISLTGTDAGNYTITSSTATGTASITVKSLTISATVSDKVYDGNTTATASLTNNKISSDDVTVNKTGATFNNKNVGVGKTVSVSGINITGTDAGNYSIISSTATGIASINAKNLTVSAIAKNKPYDGNNKADVTLSENKIIGDVISSTYILAEFDTKDVGNNKTVTVTGISISGVDAGNYSLTNTTATASASITGSPIPFAVPNAFTPNGDGKNDKFKIIFNNTTGVTLRLQIFNRNGILMFSTNDISEEWDGRYKNVMQDMGIYFVKYRIEIAGGATYEDTPRLYLFK